MRGYNQSYRLAKAVSQLTEIPILSLFNKTVDGTQQIKLDQKQRQMSLKNTFSIHEKHLSSIKDKNIVIVDDVVTTGSTCSELARIANKSKVQNIDIWCVART